MADLHEYMKAKFGTTPGQQLADLFLVTPKEMRQAKAWAKAGGLDELYKGRAVKPELSMFTPVELGFRFKVSKTMALYNLVEKEAMSLLIKMAGELMPMTNAKLPSLAPPEDDGRGEIAGVQVDEAMLAQMDESQGNQQVEMSFDDVVAQGPSHDDL